MKTREDGFLPYSFCVGSARKNKETPNKVKSKGDSYANKSNL